jgi:indolepyruvate ferredoxin oxidoreductase beta subunit
MKNHTIPADPFNIVITGVGGQGNVLASRMVGGMLTRKGYLVTIGETFGASQRGGSVMSHLRVSKKSTWSPQIPKGQAHVVVALEPLEAIRVMTGYGNMKVKVVANTRAIYPVGVIAGDQNYPSMNEVKETLAQLCESATLIDATDEAIKLGHPILGNVIMIGALAAMDVLPIDTEDLRATLAESLPKDKLDMNLGAFERGREMYTNAH